MGEVSAVTFLQVANSLPEWKNGYLKNIQDSLFDRGYRYKVWDAIPNLDPDAIAEEMGRVLKSYTYYNGYFYFTSEADAVWATLAFS